VVAESVRREGGAVRKKVVPERFTRDLECATSVRGPLKAVVLLATLKRSPRLSNTHELSVFLAKHMEKHGVETEIVRLVDHVIPPGTQSRVGGRDDWPKKVLPKVLAADIVVFATPIWWGNVSSVLQRAIERMDALNESLLETGVSPLSNKAAGIVVTGGEDGAQHVIGTIANFAVWNGLTLPPAASLSWMEDRGEDTKASLRRKFERGVQKPMAAVLARNLAHLAGVLKERPFEAGKDAAKQRLR
jgi:multimeric flavodoxin WrbA